MLPNRPEADAVTALRPSTLLEVALLLEPEIRMLQGIFMALIHLGERADPIDPRAIAVLAHAGLSAVNQIDVVRQSLETRL